MSLIKNVMNCVSASQSKLFSVRVAIPFHYYLHCPFQMCIFRVSLMCTSNETRLMSCLMTLEKLVCQHCPREGFKQVITASRDHISSSSSSSWEEPACWAALADAAAICACWAACCICNHSCWASSACCCRACRNTGKPKPRHETWEAEWRQLERIMMIMSCVWLDFKYLYLWLINLLCRNCNRH